MTDANDTMTEGFPRTAALTPRLAYVAHTESTNADLIAAAGDAVAFPHLSTVMTFDQRAGRGRLDRHWHAPAGSALAMSVLLRVAELPVSARGWIPLAAGAAMTAAISAQLPGHNVTSKWPNDIRVGEKKICGILAQATLTMDAVVVGAGVNTAMTVEQLPVPGATSFAVLGESCDVDLLMADYLTRISGFLSRLTSARGDAVASGLRDAVVSACGTIGADVRVDLPGGELLTGVATGIDETGRILVLTEAGESVAVAAGDIIHLRPRL